jgi:deoxyribonuclease IV
MTDRIRVRALLSRLNSVERAALKKLLPKGVAASPPAEPEGTRYPAALLAQLPKGEAYSLAGYITEELLRARPVDITCDLLLAITQKWSPATTADQLAKIAKSVTTEPYLAHIRETRKKVRFAARGDLAYDQVVAAAGVEGHPDIRTPTQIFEVKMTGQLAKNWVDFCFQAFAYAALDLAATDLYIVLPLQEIVWHHPVATAWPGRAAYREFLETAAVKKDASAGSALAAALLIESYLIGCHMPKLKSLVDTVRSLPAGRPSQIFLAGPQSARLAIADAELAAAAAAVTETGRAVYVHSPYIINLCTPESSDNDGFHTKLLIKNLQYGAAFGARGVVVHVGKSTKQEPETAMATMRANTVAALAHATPSCPLLLETPAGQGTEVLRTWEEFAGFVAEINDPRLRICIDTCHVFACGHDPLAYLQRFLTAHPALTRLIHFNDSATPCGSCLDRHAFCGQGEIGIEKMSAIAGAAHAAGLPMVIE